MTDDLHTMLRAAADDGAASEPATGQQLLARARQRSRRRRTRRIAVGATVIATVGTVAATVVLGAGSLPGLRGADESGPDGETGIGAYHPIELTFEEALERCRPVLDHDGYPPDADWKRDPGTDDSPIYAGDGLSMVLANGQQLPGGSDNAVCMVPYTRAERDPAWVSEPIAESGDTAGLRRQCGVVAGYDFTGWEVVIAASAAQGTEAVLRSTNGYSAFCSLEPDFGRTWAGPPAPVDDPVHITDGQEVDMTTVSEADSATEPFDGFFAHNFFVGCGDTRQIQTDNQPEDGMLCSASRVLFHQDGRRMTEAATLEVTLRGGGQTFEFPVVDGYYAVRFLDTAAGANDRIYDYVIKDESGTVLGRGTSPR